MEIKDLVVDVARLEDVRGGSNTVANASSIGPLASVNANSARNIHGGSQSIRSENAQLNEVLQVGKIRDEYTRSFSVDIVDSSFDFSVKLPRWAR